MKAESILVIFFAIAVMKINLGESRIYLRPHFWMMKNLDPKDAVVDLKLNPYRQVATMKRHPLELVPLQDTVGFDLVPQIEIDENPKDTVMEVWKIENYRDPNDAVLDLKWNPFFEVPVMKRDQSQDAVGLKMVPSQDAVGLKLVPSQEAVGLKLVPSQDAVGLKLVPSQEADNLKLIPAEDAQDVVGIRIVPPKNMPLQKSLQLVHAWNLVPSYRVPLQDYEDLELVQ